MARFTPTDIVSQYNALTPLNANFDAISTLLELCVMRDGTSPNSMLANIDMNGWKIQNLAQGTANSDAVTKEQVQDMITNGTTVNLDLSGTLSVDGAATLSSTLGVSGLLSAGGGIVSAGNVSALVDLAVTANATVGGTLGVTGAVTLSSTLGVTGAVTAASASVSGALSSASVSTGTVVATSTITSSNTGIGTAGVVISGSGGIGVYKADTHSFRSASGATTYGSFISTGLNLPTGNSYQVNGSKVVGEQGAALPADASDLATAIALVNAIKDRLKATTGHGLVAG